jgi:hypothetical protein
MRLRTIGLSRYAALAVAMVLCVASSVAAQDAGFEDVPPWHWAFEAVQRLGAAGIIVGYPTSDRERALNALAQVYDAFAHPAHPASRGWAERFLTNLPPNWPQPLERSTLVSFRLENVRVEVSGTTTVVSYVVLISLRRGIGVASSRASVRAEIQKDASGRLRVDYATLVAAQPQLFK